MSSDVVIQARGLGKKYVIGHESSERERYTALRDVIARSARNFGRATGDMIRGRSIIVGDSIEEFWALRDVTFEVRRGEVLGVIGRNGAGKSTLLKILSRITEPTEGRVEIRGRVSSLLEVGTGFHPELTGRENIYLNGAILGMTRTEIRRKFDEIVAFAEIAKFLDTPVKRYSSGMYVRLAFAVAAHLEPEILVVDEVLAVGDAEFRNKCLGKMGEIASTGRTILFVSHNIHAVSALCTRVAWLNDGKINSMGLVDNVVQQYIASIQSTTPRARLGHGQSNKDLSFETVSIAADGDCDTGIIAAGNSCAIELVVRCAQPLTNVAFEIGIRDEHDNKIANLSSDTCGKHYDLGIGHNYVFCRLERVPLYPGRYFVHVAAIRCNELLDGVAYSGVIDVVPGPFFPSGRMPSYGPLLIDQTWVPIISPAASRYIAQDG